jgi:GDPmannose 4,6-dehydratase
MKTALITGITGQDGSYLAEHLVRLGYKVHGIARRISRDCIERPLPSEVEVSGGDVRDYGRIHELMFDILPDEIYHLAAQSFVGASFSDPDSTLETNITGTLNVLKAMKQLVPNSRMYFAGSSEMFGKVAETPQFEATPFHPRSPYGVSKVAGFDLTRNYRESYDMFCCSGILFNHESERRGTQFVTRKISRAVADMVMKRNNTLVLGNLERS